ncbi:MAG: hypothetical protein JW955_05655 [Sedimentisphaerales bacterium]|nr:hypothetical protein [Sedimentisphaerales bacterium]
MVDSRWLCILVVAMTAGIPGVETRAGQGDRDTLARETVRTIDISVEVLRDKIRGGLLGQILGVMKGYRWMLAQGWQIVDRYKNTTRENVPADETITSFADRVTDLAERVILEQGGQRLTGDARIVYRINLQKPLCVLRLESPDAQTAVLREKLRTEIENGILHPATMEQLARAAYYAICLDLAASVRTEYPQSWSDALAALSSHEKVVQALFHHSPTPLGDTLRDRALAAGLKKPANRQDLW